MPAYQSEDILDRKTNNVARRPRNTFLLACLGGALFLTLPGCRSDGGKTVSYELLSPTEWFSPVNSPSSDADDVPNANDLDFALPPMPSSADTFTPPPAPAAANNYYGVQRTSATQSPAPSPRPALLPVPRSY